MATTRLSVFESSLSWRAKDTVMVLCVCDQNHLCHICGMPIMHLICFICNYKKSETPPKSFLEKCPEVCTNFFFYQLLFKATCHLKVNLRGHFQNLI